MLNLLKEYSKKSPYQSKFQPPAIGVEFSLQGLIVSVPGGRFKLVLENRFWFALGITLLLYVLAIETANDWLYLVTAAGFTTIFFGLILPFLQIVDISASCSIPPDCVAGDRIRVRVRLSRRATKRKITRMMPIKWLVVRTKLVETRDEHSVLRPITVDTVINEAWVVAQSPPLTRGVYRMEALETYSCFPFGLAWWSRSFDIGSQKTVDHPVVTVYPRISGVEGNFLYRLRASGSTALISSATRATTAMPSSSVRSLREFVTGDSPRFIHWASSAKTGKLLVREFESEGLPGYDVLIDLTAGWKNVRQFELAVSITNSLLNMGFRMGGAPELYIIPDPVQSPENLPLCLMDLPASPPGIARWAQMLARVEAVAPRDEEYEPVVPDLGTDGKLALLTVRPAQPPQDRGGQIRAIGHSLDDSVDLWVMSRAFRQASSSAEKAEAWTLGQRKAMPAHAGFADRRSGSGPPGRVLATLESFEDIAHL
ncbi:MAG: DUF58 domain-containing protein [Cyanobacteria bacterium HKST-UBA02]|nr:DUF58 domain-containing protein [Cyanobacteria bacterium HKST-UBA02]